MACPLYLALTAAEFQKTYPLPENMAWMACHLSPSGKELSNLPRSLPTGSMLMVDDWLPAEGQDPEQIAKQLCDIVTSLNVSRVLLDFQRPDNAVTGQIVDCVLRSVPCPVAVAAPYARDGFPVLISPAPPQTPLEGHLAPYKGQEVWLETALSCVRATVTEDGAAFEDSDEEWNTPIFYDEDLCCHYQTMVFENQLQFLLHRTREDVYTLHKKAASLGVTCCVGLYQELK